MGFSEEPADMSRPPAVCPSASATCAQHGTRFSRLNRAAALYATALPYACMLFLSWLIAALKRSKSICCNVAVPHLNEDAVAEGQQLADAG